MAVTKIEQWADSDGCNHNTKLNALASDVLEQLNDAHFDFDEDNEEVTDELRAAVDALHEYAHRVDLKDNPPDTQKDQPARPTLDEICALQKGDEVMISGAWFRVLSTGVCVCVDLNKPNDYVPFEDAELAEICQRIRRHGQ